MSIIIVLAAFAAGVLIGHGYHAARAQRQDEESREARQEAEFWHEQCDSWHRVAVKLGAGFKPPRKVQSIAVPRPPQQQIVAAGRTGIQIWKN